MELIRIGTEADVFVLDTDHLGIVQHRSAPEHATLIDRMHQHLPEDFYVAIVSFHEQVNGWNAYIQRARGDEGLVRGYAMFEAILVDFERMNVLPFDAEAARTFSDLRKSGVRVRWIFGSAPSPWGDSLQS
jgi:tRNA(fMet)-specific endonuclease VapC